MSGLYKAISRFEARIRGRFSHVPVLYALIGGSLMILFWRGIWHTADILEIKGGLLGFIFHPLPSLLWTTVLMLFIGVFIPLFIGEQIIIAGLKQEKSLNEKAEKEIKEEEITIDRINEKLISLNEEIAELKELIRNK